MSRMLPVYLQEGWGERQAFKVALAVSTLKCTLLRARGLWTVKLPEITAETGYGLLDGSLPVKPRHA